MSNNALPQFEAMLREAGGEFVRYTANHHKLWRLGNGYITLYETGSMRDRINQRAQVHRLIRRYRQAQPASVAAAESATPDFERVEPHEPFVPPAVVETDAERAGRQHTEWVAGNGPFDAAGPLGTSESGVYTPVPTQEDDMGKQHAQQSRAGRGGKGTPKAQHKAKACEVCGTTFTWMPAYAKHVKYAHAPSKAGKRVLSAGLPTALDGDALVAGVKRLLAENTELRRQIGEMTQALSLVATVQQRAREALRQR